MNLLPRRKRPRHTIAAVRTARASAEPPVRDAADGSVDYDTSYDHNGWGENTLAAPPAGEDTMLFRVPGLDGGPGFVIPPGLLAERDASPAWSTDRATLRDVAAALRGEGRPAAPGAYLRAIMPGGPQPFEPLAGSPVFAGVLRTASGDLQAGLYLGDEDGDGRMVIDVTDPAWLADLIEAAQEALAAIGAAEGRAAA